MRRTKFAALVAKAARKPLPVIAFRATQLLTLAFYRDTGYWQHLTAQADALPAQASQTPLLLAPRAALLENPEATAAQRAAIAQQAADIRSGRFRIFGSAIPDLATCDFSTDWRFNHRWENRYFKTYQFYEQKTVPYDVKFPWELSRLHIFIPVLLDQLLNNPAGKAIEWVHSILGRWRKENPVAYSVNWYPMEASMRTVNLTVMADILGLLKQRDGINRPALSDLQSLVHAMLLEHGEFVWRNREFSDVRGNHFTANLVALLLAGQKHGRTQWISYADRWLEREALLQFYPDGGNFEKSCAYHKLVFELFLIAAIARERMAKPFKKDILERLSHAAEFSAAITRPDGITANFGDTDDAYGLPFYLPHPRNQANAVVLASHFLHAPCRLDNVEPADSIASWLMLGMPNATPDTPKDLGASWFKDSGYVIAKNPSTGFFFMMDVGEVGMYGRGGHGHNDMLSFELCLGGASFIVDPGCSGYTADLEKKMNYRRTASHNTIAIGGEEMARLTGTWTIANDAVPQGVVVETTDGIVKIQASHTGYTRIKPGMIVTRRVEIDRNNGALTLTDSAAETEAFEGFLHLHPACKATQISSTVIELQSSTQHLRIEASVPLTLGTGLYSEGYGQETTAQMVRYAGAGPEAIIKLVPRY